MPPTQWIEGQGLPRAAGAVGAPPLRPGGRVGVVRRPPGVAISLRGMCGWGKTFLGGSDTCPWNSSQGLPLCSTLSHSLHFEKQLSKESGVLNGGSEAADGLMSRLTAGLRVVLSFLVLNAEPPEVPKHLVGLPQPLTPPVTSCPGLYSPVFTRLYTSTGQGPHPVWLCVPHGPRPPIPQCWIYSRCSINISWKLYL